MQSIDNQDFRDQAVEVDGKQFQRCVFQNARLVYAGGALPVFVDCKFKNVSLAFAEGAANTITFLAALKGRGFEYAVSNLTDAIREHKV